MLLLTLKFSERGSEGPEYDKNPKNDSKWKQKGLFRQSYKVLTNVFIITFNQLISAKKCFF